MSALLSIVLSAFSVFAPHTNEVWNSNQGFGAISSNPGTVHTNSTVTGMQQGF